MPRLNFKMAVAIVAAASLLILPIFYLNIDSIAKSVFNVVEGFKKKAGISSTVTTGKRDALQPGQVGPPADSVQAGSFSYDEGRHGIMVSRDGKARQYLINNEFWQAYDTLGGVRGILGVPTGNEYSWKGGLRQNFERGHWLFWSGPTGVKMDYIPPAYRFTGVSPLQAPIFMNGKPGVEWTSSSSTKYFITQDFGANGHFGQDLALEGNPNPGYEVRPITDGTVVFSGWTGQNAYGYLVLIRHSLDNGKNFYSQYAHLYQMPQVFAGEQVNRETVLGRVGSTGHSTGPHLDFQIKEIPSLDRNPGQAVNSIHLGYGYAPRHNGFTGNTYYDSRTGQTYYKPSYFIQNYRYNPGELLDVMHRIRDLASPFETSFRMKTFPGR